MTQPELGTDRRPLASAVLAAAMALSALASCSPPGGGAGAGPAPAEQPAAALPMAKAEIGDVVRRMQVPGTIRAEQEVVLHARANGFVAAVAKDRGDHVAASEVVATLDIPELAVERESAQASLALADADLHRLEGIRGIEKTAVTDQDLDVQRAKQATAAAAVKRIDTLLGFATVRAPFAGVVAERFVDPGALVQQGPIMRVVDVSRVRILVDVPESELRWIKVGSPGEVRLESAPGRTFPAVVSRLATSLEPATRTLRVELDHANADLAMLPSMYATVTLELERHQQVVSVPTKAVVMDQGKPVVFVPVDGKAVRTPVATGLADGVRIEIVSGLADQQAVILAAGQGVKDGMRVRAADAK
jgi:RND family efflux transporter MFP subunit